MNWWIILVVILIIFAVFMTILMFTRVHISILYKHERDQDYLRVIIQFWMFIRIEKEIPIVEIKDRMEARAEMTGSTDKEEQSMGFFDKLLDRLEMLKNFMSTIQQIWPTIKSFLQKVRIHTLTWQTQIGMVDDAAITGTISGVIWGIKGSVIGMLHQYMNVLAAPKILVNPVFQKNIAATYLECMFSFKIGQAITAFMQINRQRKKDEVSDS
ncbi:DUF2953 domain-containing protein [Salinibacillus xinjiangensis]|uniref:DUF2953 domain-containing protein n=1 Tax=Salinibacillus xinjiangensis TaxID=1229268 RepID=UPI001891943E|nr:DUF2953 domain-containing protein [Salinibacillus xinjiangensis]